jgi:hypothetical protein
MHVGGCMWVNAYWTPIYPPNHLLAENYKNTPIILVNTCIDSPNVTGIQLQGGFGTLYVLNIYNDCKHNNSLCTLEEYLHNPGVRAQPVAALLRHIWLGNFNWHPLWDEERNNHLFTNMNLNDVQMLLNLLARHGMKMALPKDIPTLESTATKNYTRVDNIFCSEELLEAFISCNTMPEKWPNKTDHMPIIA